MNKTEAHPVELAILAALVVMEALMVLVIAAAALVQCCTRRDHLVPRPIKCPSSSQTPVAAAQPGLVQLQPALAQQVVWCTDRIRTCTTPTPHPLAQLATELEALPATTLRAMAGIRSKRHNKAALVAMVAACS
jgi:hypothetical protein